MNALSPRARLRTRKSRRAAFIAAAVAAFGLAVALALWALEDTVVFFYSPSDIAAQVAPPEGPVRIGGLVVAGSIRNDGAATVFEVTDNAHTLTVAYRGVLPDLFREGQGIVAEGRFDGTGRFEASRVLAKHDENYMPPEVADALKKSGRWQHAGPQTGSQTGSDAGSETGPGAGMAPGAAE